MLDHLWGAILLKSAQLALQGSVEHLRLLAQIRGELNKSAHPAAAVRAVMSVVVGVPRLSPGAPGHEG